MNKELEEILNKARLNRDRRLITKQLEEITTLTAFREYLNENKIPSNRHQSLEDEFLQELSFREQEKTLAEKRTKRESNFGKKIQEVVPTFLSWAKRDMEIVDKHLNGNTVGNKLADLIQDDENKYQKEGKKSDEIRAKFIEEFDNSRIENPNNPETTTNQNSTLRECLALGLGGYIVALGLMMSGNIKGVKSFKEFIDTNPSPEVIKEITKKTEQNKQFLSPNIELEKPFHMFEGYNKNSPLSQLEQAKSEIQTLDDISNTLYNSKLMGQNELIIIQKEISKLRVENRATGGGLGNFEYINQKLINLQSFLKGIAKQQTVIINYSDSNILFELNLNKTLKIIPHELPILKAISSKPNSN